MGASMIRVSLALSLTLFLLLNDCSGVHVRQRRQHDCQEKTLERREEEANVVFTGTVKKLYPDNGHPDMMKAQVEIKRVIKGNNVINNLPGVAPHMRSRSRSPWNRRVVTVDGIGDPDICDSYARKYDTRIFMSDKLESGDLKLTSSLLRLTLNNLDRADAAVKDKPFVPKPTPPQYPCETYYCAFGAQCLVDEDTNDAYCKCLEKCNELFAPVCGNDGVTYTSECHLRVASCSQQRRIIVSSQGKCNARNPCLEKHCDFGAVCVPSLDGLTARCQCPERCDNYGDSQGSMPVCGDDGRDYANTCEMDRESCRNMKEIKIKYHGKCDPCQGVECPMSQICQLDEERHTICRCDNMCPYEFSPVCGSDGRTYSNQCMMQVESCKSRKEIRVLYHGECPQGNNPCNSLQCGPYEECYVNRQGIATCTCPPACEPVLRPVCGSDEMTYDNECELKRTSCMNRRAITVSFVGKCSPDGPCTNYKCRFGAMCIVRDDSPFCECPTCRDSFDPVCGTDGVSYENECKLKVENCEKQKKVRVASKGLCNGCDDKTCDYYGVCEGDGRGGTRCVCPGPCVQVKSEVCGTNSITYRNWCELKLDSCRKQEYLVIGTYGSCDECDGVRCSFGARCENGRCVCPQDCTGKIEYVCASDGRTYENECELRRRACALGSDLVVVHSGPCDDEIPGSGEGSGSEVCDDLSCQFGGTCDPDVGCMCSFNCEAIRAPVCGSDGMTYGNECQMREESCRKQMEIFLLPMENCEDMDEEMCDGNAALFDPQTGREYDCRDGRDMCPAGSYCHRMGGVARCCKEDEPVRTCTETRFGCCSDGKTAAPGINNAGCPDTCQCNDLGSLSETCDPIIHQCTCKPGVGGYRCDRCEPGFWGMKLMATMATGTGNSGCIPCGCNIYGSIRDDCDQSLGRCVCKPGIEGQKCQECLNGKMLGPGGCTDASPPTRPCQELECRFGARCEMRNSVAECICPGDCSSEEYPMQVCGTDGQSYGSACQLRHLACRLEQDIEVAYDGECTGPRPTNSPIYGRPRKTTRHVYGKNTGEGTTATPYGTLGDFCIEDIECYVRNSYCKTGICTCLRGFEPNLQKTACEAMNYIVPSFSGDSYMQLTKMINAETRTTIEIQFRSSMNDGIIVYNGQNNEARGDFISLAIKDGYVEFRFDLGSGSAILQTSEQISLNTFHHVTAKRHGKEAMLQLDDHPAVSGTSAGTLKSLNLKTPLYLGKVPDASEIVLKSIGVYVGFAGCIESLKVETEKEKEYDLRYPSSGDIESEAGISECGENPCSSMPCQNGGKCDKLDAENYVCICEEEFTGKDCSCSTSTDSCMSSDGRICNDKGVCECGRCNCELDSYYGPTCEDCPTCPGGCDFHKACAQCKGFSTGPYTTEECDANCGHVEVVEFIDVSGSDPSKKMCMFRDSDDCEFQFSYEYDAGKVEVQKMKHDTTGNGCGSSGSSSCDPNPCQNSGSCLDIDGSYVCICTSDWHGDHCENEGGVDVTIPEMHGHSYIDVKLNKKPGHSLKFELWFMSTKPDGVLLYNVQSDIEMAKADFLSLNLEDSYLVFRYDLGSGMADIVSPEAISLNVWHKVEISRQQKQGMMIIDGDVTVTGLSGGNLKELNLPKNLYIGGYPGDYHSGSGGSIGLRGAVQRFYEEGVRIDDLVSSARSSKHVHQYDGEPCPSFDNPCSNNGMCLPNLNDFECLCVDGFLGRTCDIDAATVNTDGPVSFGGFTQHKYQNKVTLKQNGQRYNEYEIRFRTTADEGLLLLQHKSADIKGDYLAISMVEGYVEISYNLGKEPPSDLFFVRSDTMVNDGQWHTLFFIRDKRKGSLTVDGGRALSEVSAEGATQLDTDGNLWIGGAPAVPEGLPEHYYIGFDGCIDSIHIEGDELLLVEHRISHDHIEFCTL